MSSIVLIVDDDPVSLHLLQIILDRNGYQVITARSGALGLELARSKRPAAVIVDDMMPGMSGGELCQQIKSDHEIGDLPVILISAGNRIQEGGYVYRVGADYALLKPIMQKDVLKALETVLNK